VKQVLYLDKAEAKIRSGNRSRGPGWTRATGVILVALLASSPAFADKKGGGKGNNKGHKGDYSEQYEDRGGHGSQGHRDDDHGDWGGGYFTSEHRTIINNYYAGEFSRGQCPPGLAKKHNGCMPPGQAKRWQRGQPLPHDVTYYDLPASVVVQLRPPPAGARYVRVAGDILLLAVGTNMVLDALSDLSR
jgi:Ni/Co efflux regulator RcnB